MTTYTASIWHGNGTVGTLQLKSKNDQQAIAELDAIVAAGYRNETGAGVELSDGQRYTARNVHGEASGHFAPAYAEAHSKLLDAAECLLDSADLDWSRRDDSILVTVDYVADDDSELDQIRQLLGKHYCAEWTGNGNTDGDGNDTCDIRVTLA